MNHDTFTTGEMVDLRQGHVTLTGRISSFRNRDGTDSPGPHHPWDHGVQAVVDLGEGRTMVRAIALLRHHTPILED